MQLTSAFTLYISFSSLDYGYTKLDMVIQINIRPLKILLVQETRNFGKKLLMTVIIACMTFFPSREPAIYVTAGIITSYRVYELNVLNVHILIDVYLTLFNILSLTPLYITVN